MRYYGIFFICIHSGGLLGRGYACYKLSWG